MRPHPLAAGFTLIEVMIVVAIIAILAAVAYPAYTEQVARGKRADGKAVELASKCDLCLTRPEGPACVQMCPHGSAVRISFKDIQTVTNTMK